MDTSSHPKRDASGGSNDFKGNKGTDIANELFSFTFQFLRPEPVIVIINFYCIENVAFFIHHKVSPYSNVILEPCAELGSVLFQDQGLRF
jgi:hypothetical protein